MNHAFTHVSSHLSFIPVLQNALSIQNAENPLLLIKLVYTSRQIMSCKGIWHNSKIKYITLQIPYRFHELTNIKESMLRINSQNRNLD